MKDLTRKFDQSEIQIEGYGKEIANIVNEYLVTIIPKKLKDMVCFHTTLIMHKLTNVTRITKIQFMT